MDESATKSIPEPDDDEEARLDAEAIAAHRNGRYVLHAEVVKWLDSWGTPNELPRPQPKQN